MIVTIHQPIWHLRQYHDVVSFTMLIYRKSSEIHHRRPIHVIARTIDTIHTTITTPTIQWWIRIAVQCHRIVHTHDPNSSIQRPVQLVRLNRTRQCVAVKLINDSTSMINSLPTKVHHARTRIEATIIELCNVIFQPDTHLHTRTQSPITHFHFQFLWCFYFRSLWAHIHLERMRAYKVFSVRNLASCEIRKTNTSNQPKQ